MEFIHVHPNYFNGVSIGMEVKEKWETFIRWHVYGPYDFIQSRWNPFVSNDGCITLG
jgi:hypothetical protein